VARIGIGVALIALLYHWRLIDSDALRSLAARPEALALAFAVALAAIPLEALRWRILLRAQGIELAPWPATRLLAASLFFANFLPGAAGGDLMRAAHLYKTAKGKRAAALLSILADRFIGFAAFLLLGVAAVAARPSPPAMSLAIVAVAASVAAALVLLGFGGPSLTAALARRSPRFAHILVETEGAFRQYARAWPSAALALALSIPVVMLAVAPVAILAEAMRVPGVGALDYGTAGLYALLANALPVTPGGLGVGETAFASAVRMLAPQAGPAAFGTIFLAYRGIVILATLPGLFAYLAED
jgi:uncharacterized protein (TIRG00374 family)